MSLTEVKGTLRETGSMWYSGMTYGWRPGLDDRLTRKRYTSRTGQPRREHTENKLAPERTFTEKEMRSETPEV